MTDRVLNVLVLCTGNSARSILGEAIFQKLGEDKIRSFSAGSKPKGVPHPGALLLLTRKGIDTCTFRSKSWNEFTKPDAQPIDIAITVCDNAAQESCPVFMGAGSDAEVEAAFEETWEALTARVEAFLALPLGELDQEQLADELTRIGEMEGAA